MVNKSSIPTNLPLNTRANILSDKLASTFDIEIYWFYGEAGHGKGLVDAMPSFGCKNILRDAIVCDDKWFENAAEMVSILKYHCVNDESRQHFVIHR